MTTMPKFYLTLCFVNGLHDPYTRTHTTLEEALEFSRKQVQRNTVYSCVILESIKEVVKADNPVTVTDIE